MTRRVAFMCEPFEHVPDGTSVATGEAWNGPIRTGDVFTAVLGSGRAERWLALTVASISLVAAGQVAELRRGQKGRLTLTGSAPPEIEGGWVLSGEEELP